MTACFEKTYLNIEMCKKQSTKVSFIASLQTPPNRLSAGDVDAPRKKARKLSRPKRKVVGLYRDNEGKRRGLIEVELQGGMNVGMKMRACGANCRARIVTWELIFFGMCSWVDENTAK